MNLAKSPKKNFGNFLKFIMFMCHINFLQLHMMESEVICKFKSAMYIITVEYVEQAN